jgi:hypothetical protein
MTMAGPGNSIPDAIQDDPDETVHWNPPAPGGDS